MEFSKLDFIYELEFNYKGSSKEQLLISNFDKFKFIKSLSNNEFNNFTKRADREFIREILQLNDVIRVEKKSHFKIHKSYPSPRSLYPIKILVSIGSSFYVTKNDIQDVYELYSCEDFNVQSGDIVLEFNDKYLEDYKSIKKSLLLLEMGHLLFNLLYIIKVYGKKYMNGSGNFGLLHLKLISSSNQLDKRSLNRFKEKYYYRNSGPYNHPITNTNVSFIEDELPNYSHSIDDISSFFKDDKMSSNIRVDTYVNQGSGVFISINDDNIINYRTLNLIYPYINFWGVSMFTIFSLHKIVFLNKANKYLAALGYLSQNTSLVLSKNPSRYNRPIKSFKIKTLEKLINYGADCWIPYYALITGEI